MPLRIYDTDRISNDPTPSGLHVSCASSGDFVEDRIQPFKLQFKPLPHLRHRSNPNEHSTELG